jgi:O-antigen/teichoic acid export membrane protein
MTQERWKMFWALVDQGAVSLGTFLTSVILARSLSPMGYGIFVLICSVINFLNSLHSALVTIPLSTRGARTEAHEIRRIATGSLILTTMLTLPLGAVMCAATWIVGRPRLAPWAIMLLVLWQVQETMRRAFMARLRHREAAWGDIISYLGQAALVWTSLRYWELTVEGALIMMAVTSGAAGLVQMVQHGLSWIEFTEIHLQAVVFWGLGRWMLMTSFVGIFLSQAYPWALAFFYGARVAAEFQAVSNILGISHPVAFGIGSLIYPAVARARGEHGERAATRIGFSYGLRGGMLLLPFYLILVIWPQSVLRLFYGAGSPYLDLSGILRLFVLAYLIGYLANLMVVILNSLERTRVAFLSQLASAITTIVIGLPLVIWGGIAGATAAGGLTSLTRLMASGFFLRQREEIQRCEQR